MKKKLLGIGAGVVLGIVGEKILKSETTKNFVVNTVSGGLKVKDSVDKTIEKAKENAEDIVVEAKTKNAEKEKTREEAETAEDLAAKAEDVKDAADELVEEATK